MHHDEQTAIKKELYGGGLKEGEGGRKERERAISQHIMQQDSTKKIHSGPKQECFVTTAFQFCL
jgi:hypothetical protein